MSRFFAPLACAFALACVAPAYADTVAIVRGTVVRDGQPVAGTRVHLYGDRFAAQTTTDSKGTFAFTRVPFGHYTLHANVGGEPAVADVAVATNTVVVVTLAPAAVKTIGTTLGTVRGVRGTPVSENAMGERAIAVLPRNGSLNGIVESVPGVVRFSYNEPVVHGFHGLTYEIDGAPLPQNTSSTFAEIIDPRNVQAVEVFTGAFPAEFGGSRQGAVVNVISRAPELGSPRGTFSLGGGNYGSAAAHFNEDISSGKTAIHFSSNESRTNRGIDAPTADASLRNDSSNLSDQFLRVVAPLGTNDRIAFDASNQFATFQIPINTNPNDPNDAFVSAPGTNDVQREYDRFASASFTHTSSDGLGFVQIVPWVRSSRVAYDGDVPNDLLGTALDPNTGLRVAQNALRQDLRSTNVGLRASVERSSDFHALKAGIDIARETVRNNGFIVLANGGGTQSNAIGQAGTLFGAYLEDRWALGQRFAMNAGVRYDRSTGFVDGAQLSPRFELNYSPDRTTVFHGYVGRLYAAPALEDTRRDAVITGTSATAAPVYDLKPERDSYVEFGIAHTFRPGFTMYANAWQRNVTNVLDTTQLLNTPLSAVFNNAVGHANGLELRVQDDSPSYSASLSATLSESLAGGISGSSFLFDPATVSNLTLNPEDHDQAVTLNAVFTHRFGAQRSLFATLAPEYGTGFPTTFQNGAAGRLPTHAIVNMSFGRAADRATHRLGFQVTAENLFNHQYVIKVNNGFNTTQWAEGRRISLQLTTAF